MDIIDILKIILLGVVEGITEWLPVSSTGHLILVNRFAPLDFSAAFTDMFEYVIQLAAILAVVLIFWKRIFPIGKKESLENGEGGLYLKKDVLSLWGKVIVACVPALIAFFIDKFFLEKVSALTQNIMIAAALIFYGVVFLVVERFNKNREPKINEISQLSYKTAFIIGCFQLLAVIPGTSRSGITIIAALLLCVSRPTAAEFTFFLAIPTMVGASAYKILNFFVSGNALTLTEGLALLIGCSVAFLVSMVAVKFLMNFVRKHDFKIFGWYRIALGLVVLAAIVIPTMV